jgi:shikimate dehydrogenase
MSLNLQGYSGATQVVFIAGDPIAQVKSPAGVTELMRARGADALCVPAHVKPADLSTFLQLAERMPNVSGILITVPHKFDSLPLCSTLTARAKSIEAVNMMKRGADGHWHGDMCDGEAFVRALLHAGAVLKGQRALLVGAGGAGSAIAHALVDAGVAEVALHDADAGRREALAAKLRRYGPGVAVTVGSSDPTGFAVVCNATPMGMKPGDPLPVRVDRLAPSTFVGDVVTMPPVPPLIEAARARGCATMTGAGMFEAVRDRMVTFYLERKNPRP